MPNATMKPIPGKLYTSYDWLAAVEVIDGLCVVDMMICVYNTPFMFLEWVEAKSVTGTAIRAAKALFGEKIYLFCNLPRTVPSTIEYFMETRGNE